MGIVTVRPLLCLQSREKQVVAISQLPAITTPNSYKPRFSEPTDFGTLLTDKKDKRDSTKNPSWVLTFFSVTLHFETGKFDVDLGSNNTHKAAQFKKSQHIKFKKRNINQRGTYVKQIILLLELPKSFRGTNYRLY